MSEARRALLLLGELKTAGQAIDAALASVQRAIDVAETKAGELNALVVPIDGRAGVRFIGFSPRHVAEEYIFGRALAMTFEQASQWRLDRIERVLTEAVAEEMALPRSGAANTEDP